MTVIVLLLLVSGINLGLVLAHLWWDVPRHPAEWWLGLANLVLLVVAWRRHGWMLRAWRA
jgi:hypothetical protein